MDLGLSFSDDDLFEGRERKEIAVAAEYVPKFCEAEWFTTVSCDDGNDIVPMIKMRADQLFLLNRFDEAAQLYRQIVSSETHRYLRRDALEALARSLVHTGQLTEARSVAEELDTVSSNSEQRTTSLSVLATVFEEMDAFQDLLGALQQLVCLHEFNSEYWLKLGQSYALIDSIPLSCLNKKHFREENKERACHITPAYKVAACLVRALVILRSVQGSVKSFVLERNLKLQSDISKQLELLSLPENFIAHVTEVYTRDVLGEDTENKDFEDLGSSSKTSQDELSNLSKSSSISVLDFEKKWFEPFLVNKCL